MTAAQMCSRLQWVFGSGVHRGRTVKRTLQKSNVAICGNGTCVQFLIFSSWKPPYPPFWGVWMAILDCPSTWWFGQAHHKSWPPKKSTWPWYKGWIWQFFFITNNHRLYFIIRKPEPSIAYTISTSMQFFWAVSPVLTFTYLKGFWSFTQNGKMMKNAYCDGQTLIQFFRSHT